MVLSLADMASTFVGSLPIIEGTSSSRAPTAGGQRSVWEILEILEMPSIPRPTSPLSTSSRTQPVQQEEQ